MNLPGIYRQIEAVLALQDGLCWLQLDVNSSEAVEAKCADSVVTQTTNN
jgi:hypothetical protein